MRELLTPESLKLEKYLEPGWKAEKFSQPSLLIVLPSLTQNVLINKRLIDNNYNYRK